MEVVLASLKGKRKSNEDTHNIILNIDGKNDVARINFFGLYDGHGGKFVSKYLQDNLPKWFLDKRVQYPLTKPYILSVFNHLQNELKERHRAEALHCGSTCLIAIHFKNENDDYMNIINAGDSRCVLCRDNHAISITKDHKPYWPEEKRRIEQLGGQIYSDGSDFRIKDLSVSRAFGDIDATPFLTQVPDIFRFKIEKSDSFLILACDGIWDVLSNSDVINFILNECYDETLRNRINKDINISKKLAEYALQKGSGDNLTVIIIFFK